MQVALWCDAFSVSNVQRFHEKSGMHTSMQPQCCFVRKKLRLRLELGISNAILPSPPCPPHRSEMHPPRSTAVSARQAHHKESNCLFVLPYLNTREYDEQLHGKVWQLEHDAAAFSTPLLLPAVEPVGNQAPAEADKTLLSHHLLPCASHTSIVRVRIYMAGAIHVSGM